MMSKKSPQLRFEGFTDDWEERKLGDVVGEIQSGNRLPKDSLTNGDVPYVVAQTKNDGVFKKIARGTLDYNGNPMKLFPGNSISFSIDNPEAMFYRNAEFYTSNIMRVIHEDHLTHEQYVFILENMKRFIRGYDWSRKFSGPVVSNLEYLQPSEEEQQKIGSFFKQLDDIIALHQRKLDLLKEQKKGYLQKMFPKNGAKVPELRFAGFADDWELRKFKDIIEKLTGGASIKPSDYLEEGIRTIPKGAVNSTGLADLSGSKYISEEFYESNKSSHVSTNNLVTSLRDLVSSAPNMGRIVRIAGEDEDFLMPQGVYKLELFDGMDEEFLIAFSNSDKYRKIISSEKNGSTQVHIRNGEFLNIDIELPFSEEQKQIGSFFKQLDNSIALHQRKLDLLKEQKKGFLQKMFI